jgi:predicted transcriptional regulator
LAKKSIPMHNDTHKIFIEPSDVHAKVITSLVKKGYTTEMIAKASGLTESQVEKIIKERKIA